MFNRNREKAKQRAAQIAAGRAIAREVVEFTASAKRDPYLRTEVQPVNLAGWFWVLVIVGCILTVFGPAFAKMVGV